jgi:hypothetical protein
MVEGGQEFYKPEQWLVWEKLIHLLDGSHWKKLQVLRHGSPGIHYGDLREQLQLGSNNFQAIEHLCTTGSDAERRGSTYFHMASYLLDVIYARNVFVDMNLSWNVAELPVHVYFNILWENRYKKSYALICDEFIAQIYFILFKKECPRLSATTKKMISKVGHWYLDEHTTYIRVFGATRAPHLLPAHVPD